MIAGLSQLPLITGLVRTLGFLGLLGALVVSLPIYWKLRRDPGFYERRIAPLIN